MGSSIKIFCLLLVFNYIASEDFVEFTFDAIPLGHCGLLVTWKPNITTQIEETMIKQEYFFEFEIYIIEEENEVNYKFYENQNYILAKRINNYDSILNDNEVYSSAGQYKIHSLNENTPYNVTIKQYSGKNHHTFLKEYSVQMKTKFESQKMPAKPYFEYEDVEDRPNFVKTVRWYPCGKERICNDQESGTHFGVTIKEPYNTRKLSEVKKEEFFNDYIDILFWPGIYYEVAVYSINGDCKIESTSREIFFKPAFTLVQFVRIISLPDSSALISWKPPKQSLSKSLEHRYFFGFGENNTDVIDQSILFEYSTDFHRNWVKEMDSNYEQIRIFDLKPEVIYHYVIFPYNKEAAGFQYRTKQKFQVCDKELPIAKPDFNYKFEKTNWDYCYFYFQWLPCGQSFNCENTTPGSNYTFHFEPEPPEKSDAQEHGYYEGIFIVTPAYHVTVKSSIGNNFSESVTKIFKDCKIQENTP